MRRRRRSDGTRPSRAWAAASGLALDQLLGEPPTNVHPVAKFGIAMNGLERVLWRDHRGPGVLHALLGTALGAAAGGRMRSTAGATYVAVAGRELRRAATRVGDALTTGELATARSLLPTLVGRDPSQLDENEIARAAVESVAENTVDAVVAPVLWAWVAGAPGVLAHRAVNTMDAMVGHHSERYESYGWASARLDDAMAWVPARATAALVVAVRPASRAAIWRAVRDDAPHHPSPNAGVAEASFAAALGIRLGGTNAYGDRVEHRARLGNGRDCEPRDVARAVRLSADVTAALAGVLLAVGAVRR